MSEVKKINGDFFGGSDEQLYPYTVPNAKTGELLGTLYFRNIRQNVIDKYRDIRNGDGRRKGDAAKAREFLFRKIFVKFEFAESGVEFDLEEFKTELDFFIARADKVVDASIIAFLGEVFPDVDAKK